MLNPPMKFSKNGLALTEYEEGLRLHAYQDEGGVWTIGYGHTGPEVHSGLIWTQQQAEDQLSKDVETAENEVNRLVNIPLAQYEFDALVDFEFNTGGLAHSHLLIYINEGDFNRALGEFAKWDHIRGGGVSQVLARRRAKDAGMFKEGMDNA